MNSSKRVIKEIFKNKEFLELVDDYFKGDIDPYDPQNWIVDSWGMEVYRLDMDENGAREMKTLMNRKFALNITHDADTMFSAIVVDKNKAALLSWLIDTIGFDYENMEDFDPYDYDTFSEIITMYGDNNV